MNCKLCKNKVTPFFSLGKMPLVNSFLKEEDISKEKKYDLTVGFCKKCFLVQLAYIVPPRDLYRHYLYFSSTSSSFLKHCDEVSSYLAKKLKLTSKSLVVEIASNDGTMLSCFKKRGMKILGVDPAKNIAKKANKRGIKTIPEFFNLSLAKNLKNKKVTASLIYGANVLAHVPGIRDFVKGVKVLLSPEGSAVFEFPYIKGLMENKFDTIYHEHVFYYSLLALRNLFTSAGLEVYDVEQTEMQGGSLLIYVSHMGKFKINRKVANLARKEIKLGYKKIDTYKKIEKNTVKIKAVLTGIINKISKEGKSVAIYSAPAKGNILLNYFGIDREISFIVDKSPAKQGLYTPGTHMKVLSPKVIAERKPDYLLILCWNIAEEVMKEQKEYKKNGGKFIIPVPKVKII